MRFLRFSLFAAVSVLLLGSTLIGQTPGIAPRVAGPVEERSLVVFSGSVPPVARAEFDQGVAPANTPMSHVRLVLSRTSAQQADLDKYAADLLDKSSPSYHKWLTPEQFGRLYGPADSDLAAIVAWLQSHGLQVDPIAPGRTNVAFSGTVQQIEEALHTSIHSYERNGEKFLANSTDPSIPAALAPVISGVARLNTIRPKPHFVRGGTGFFDPSSGRMRATPAATKGPHANLTLGSGTSADPYNLFLTPGDAATIYDTPNSVLNANFSSPQKSYTGKNVKIGIGGDAAINAGTVALYRQRFIGDTAQPTITYCSDITNTPGAETCSGSSAGLTLVPGDVDEAYLDTEVSGALAPSASIYYYASGDLIGAIDYAINQNLVDIFSLSFGGCESDWGTSGNQLLNSFWQEAALQGIAVAVSTGDSGSAGCDYPDSTKTQLAQLGFAVNAFASTPYNIAVGGTDLAGLATSFTTYAATTNSSATLYRTALNYIPESSWNDSTTINATLSANIPFTNSSGFTNIFAGAGGKSSCSVSTTTSCTSGYPKPTWQRGTGVPNDAARDLPDVSLMSGAGTDFAAWVVCDDANNCATQNGSFPFVAIGGTSAATPAFAGMLALVQEKTGSRLGQAAKELYDLYNGTHGSAIFHDTTVGNNSVPCGTGTPNCQANGFLGGYDTKAGYDLATGLGSVDVAQLVTYWGTATGSGTTTVTVVPSAATLLRSTAITAAVTVKGSAATGNPTGTVTLSGGGYTASAQALTASGTDSATYSFSIPANSLARGSDTLIVTYSGDSVYASQTGTTAVTVTALTPTVTVTPASLTLNSNASLNVTALVAGTGGTPTGTVTLSGGGYTSTAQNLNSAGGLTFNVPAFSFTTSGAVALTVNYSGDATYNAASGTHAITVTVSTFTLSASDIPPFTAGSTTGNVSTVKVTPIAGYLGNVTLTAVVTASPSGAVGAPTLTGSTVAITNATPQTGTVTVATTAASAVHAASNRGAAWFKAAGGTALAALLFFFLPVGFRRGRRIFSAFLVVVAATFTIVGCGGGSSTPQKTTPSVTVSATPSSFSAATATAVAITVSGGTAAATGTVTLSGGGFSGTATTLASGAATVNIPANKLTVGTDTLTATYSGDSNYNSASGTTTVTVKTPGTTTGQYTVTVTGTGSDAAHTSATTTFTLTVN